MALLVICAALGLAVHGCAAGPMVRKGPLVIKSKTLDYGSETIGVENGELRLDASSKVEVDEKSSLYVRKAKASLKNSEILVPFYSDLHLDGPVEMLDSRIDYSMERDYFPQYMGLDVSEQGKLSMDSSKIRFASTKNYVLRSTDAISSAYVSIDDKLTLKKATIDVGVQSFIHAGCNSIVHGNIETGRMGQIVLDGCESFFVGPGVGGKVQMKVDEASLFALKGKVAFYVSASIEIKERSSLTISSSVEPFTCTVHDPVVLSGNVVIEKYDSPKIPVGIRCLKDGSEEAKKLKALLLV